MKDIAESMLEVEKIEFKKAEPPVRSSKKPAIHKSNRSSLMYVVNKFTNIF